MQVYHTMLAVPVDERRDTKNKQMCINNTVDWAAHNPVHKRNWKFEVPRNAENAEGKKRPDLRQKELSV